jgi:hypothetical protein
LSGLFLQKIIVAIFCIICDNNNMGMAQKAETKNNMTKKEAMDILMQHVAEGKRDIAAGRYYTPDQSFAMTRADLRAKYGKQ